MSVFDVKITVLEALKPLTIRSFTNSGLTINTNRLIFLWGYVDAQVYCMTSMIYLFRLPLITKAIYRKNGGSKVAHLII
ncbi:hypothetical protein ALC53_07149 [Atta colombica]|uniref:Uncharacterized protein n=1 Tax=Atta colombica TaxID=520822 RepID=A0A195BCR7_9HYME|nr:hypothetical protein ALC53_07149 [Atta colombica]